MQTIRCQFIQNQMSIYTKGDHGGRNSGTKMTRLNQLTKPWKEKEKGHNLNDKRPKDRMNEK